MARRPTGASTVPTHRPRQPKNAMAKQNGSPGAGDRGHRRSSQAIEVRSRSQAVRAKHRSSAAKLPKNDASPQRRSRPNDRETMTTPENIITISGVERTFATYERK